MMDATDRDMLIRISHSLEKIATYLDVVDRAENLRRGDHPNTRSPIAQEMSMARALLEQLLRQTTPTPSAGDLLSHVVDTDGDPAKVREGMTDRQANGLLWDSLVRAGTPQDQAQIIADLYVPVQDGTALAAERAARTHTLRDFPTPHEEAAARATAIRERGDALRGGKTPTTTVEEDVARHLADHTPTPRDIASRNHGEDQ